VWLGFFAALGGWLAAHGASHAVVGTTAIVALGVPLAGWAFPPLLRIVFVGLSYATYPVGWVVSTVVLCAMYYLVLTPVGLVARLFGYDPLARGFDRQARSYWVARRPREGLEGYFRQS
jgi:ABC-type uncharacterized transport system permease subunit